MNIALPILLLVFGGLTFWILTESLLKWYIKTACISVFCVFTIVFWSSLHSFLGWPANEDDIPEKILIHWVIIKEPNKLTKSDGRIYVLLESAEEIETNSFLKFFGYEKKEKIEPRLHGLSYSRELHEQIEKEIMGSLKRGQPVMGSLKKKKANEGRSGEEGEGEDGDGSESQKQEWHFHKLLPSDIHRKPDR